VTGSARAPLPPLRGDGGGGAGGPWAIWRVASRWRGVVGGPDGGRGVLLGRGGGVLRAVLRPAGVHGEGLGVGNAPNGE